VIKAAADPELAAMGLDDEDGRDPYGGACSLRG